ncbi:hypothetical protein ACN38_g9127 [Penicillium nordicum]|uniref:Uncharacterized protein n=1 Tax=Penicillium nordicum TaxID=229535 RepID=A0A0M8P3P5_9EURO|nr:hypothetical protein ACN38_g9127 [Penicillium nordicum]
MLTLGGGGEGYIYIYGDQWAKVVSSAMSPFCQLVHRPIPRCLGPLDFNLCSKRTGTGTNITLHYKAISLRESIHIGN